MKLNKLNNLIQDNALCKKIFNNEKKIYEENIGKALLNIQEGRDEAITTLVTKLLNKVMFEVNGTINTKDTSSRESCRLLGKIKETFEEQKDTIASIYENVMQLLERIPSNAERKKKNTQAFFTEYGKFPEHTFTLPELLEVGKRLNQDGYKKAKTLFKTMKAMIKQDPAITSLTKTDLELFPKEIRPKYNGPFDFNRFGRELNQVYLNASEVTFPEQKYILWGCPHNVSVVNHFFQQALEKNISVLVSTHQATEALDRSNAFWSADSVNNLSLNGGWKLEHLGGKALAEDTKPNEDGRIPRLVETTIRATKKNQERFITHLHYDGWKDRHPMPSLQLFDQLLDRMQELNPDPQIPVAINCVGGVGRTGTTAVSLLLRRKIDQRRKENGQDWLDSTTVNIPEIIYEFRKQRESIVGNEKQFTQIHAAAHMYYQKSKNTKLDTV